MHDAHSARCLGDNVSLVSSLFGLPEKQQPTTKDFVEQLHYTNHLKVASDRMKARYYTLANSALSPERRLSLGVSPDPEQRTVIQTAVVLGRSLQGYHQGQRCSLQNPGKC
jgi:hypothetical protein